MDDLPTGSELRELSRQRIGELEATVAALMAERDTALAQLVAVRAEWAEARRDMAKAVVDREALIDLHVQVSAATTHDRKPLWDILIPDDASPLGWAWYQDYESEAAARRASLVAAGLPPAAAGTGDAVGTTRDDMGQGRADARR